MTSEYLGLDVGQANELKLAFRRFDWDNTLIKRLCEGGVLGNALDILRGDVRVVPVERVIDMTTVPQLGNGHAIVKHLKLGKKLWRRTRLAVMNPHCLHYETESIPFGYWDDRALFSAICKGTRLNRKTMVPHFLHGQRPANICVRDFLVENPHLIPRDFFRHAGRPLVFWGTVCRNDRGTLYVPGLELRHGKWEKYSQRVENLATKKEDLDHHYENPCVVLSALK